MNDKTREAEKRKTNTERYERVRLTAGSDKDVEDGKNEEKTNDDIVYIIEFMLFVLIIQVDAHHIHQSHT